jgi:predicted ArsR family transcriptional regulator
VRDPFSAIGALADPVRRRLYEFVSGSAEGAGREEAARAVGVPAHRARFHLDKLVEEGLLRVENRRLSGRSGPGAGRPAKIYRRSATEVAVSLPERGYELVGQVLAAAVQRSLDGVPVADALAEEARAAGRRDGTAYAEIEREDAGAAAGQRRELDGPAAVLAGRGYEPTLDGESVVLRNCPFDALAREHTALVCGVNVDYVGGVLEGLGCRAMSARLDPGPDRCCVRVVGSPAQA